MWFYRNIKETLKYVIFRSLAQIGKRLAPRDVPILTYHSVDGSRSSISVNPSTFRTQMFYLRGHGFTTIDLIEYINNLKSGIPFPEKSFVLTFDDGFYNIYRNAFPILNELGFTATIFLVTDLMGQKPSWDMRDEIRKSGVTNMPLMNWNDALEMQRYGFSFGSHGSRHRHLTELNEAELYQDIEDSKCAIENALASPCKLFCYPYGEFNSTLQRILRDLGFEGAVTTLFGRNRIGSDFYSLRRIGSAFFTNAGVFEACIYGVYGWHRCGK